MKIRTCVAAFAVILALTPRAFAQVDQGRIAGSVRDQSRAFMGGVTVKVKNERTGDDARL